MSGTWRPAASRVSGGRLQPNATGLIYSLISCVVSGVLSSPAKLTEARPRIDIWAAQKAGSLAPGAVTRLDGQGTDRGYLRALPDGRILATIGGVETLIPVTTDQPMPLCARLWFQCSGCVGRCRYLYLPELRCARCLGLQAACRLIESHWSLSLQRCRRLRLRLGCADTRPFTPIRRPRGRGERWRRLTMQLAQEEAKLIAGLRRFADAVERKGARDDR
jgi:hypothetical protein